MLFEKGNIAILLQIRPPMNCIGISIKFFLQLLSGQWGRGIVVTVMTAGIICASLQPVIAQQQDEKDKFSQITLQLPWHHQFQFAGYYAAIEQNYYKNAASSCQT